MYFFCLYLSMSRHTHVCVKLISIGFEIMFRKHCRNMCQRLVFALDCIYVPIWWENFMKQITKTCAFDKRKLSLHKRLFQNPINIMQTFEGAKLNIKPHKNIRPFCIQWFIVIKVYSAVSYSKKCTLRSNEYIKCCAFLTSILLWLILSCVHHKPKFL